MSRSTLYLIPPQRLQRAAQHAERSCREAASRGHGGAARLWQEIHDRCLAALEDAHYGGTEVRGQLPPLRKHQLRQVQNGLGPAALSRVRIPTHEMAHGVGRVQAVCRMASAFGRNGLRRVAPSFARCALATTVRRVRQGVVVTATEVA